MPSAVALDAVLFGIDSRDGFNFVGEFAESHGGSLAALLAVGGVGVLRLPHPAARRQDQVMASFHPLARLAAML
jgi:hypothetical protein